MRIISGSFRGKKILEPKDNKTRPLKDLTKESIFNIIMHSNKFKISFTKSCVLDLFSGVGSFGIECLSRGVKKVIFIENYQGVIHLLKKNLLALKTIKNYEIIEKDIYSENIFLKLNNKFDIIFLDPPYKDKSLEKLLNEIGFSSIKRYDWRNTEHANIDDHSQAYYPHMDKENGLLISLNIEAHKL